VTRDTSPPGEYRPSGAERILSLLREPLATQMTVLRWREGALRARGRVRRALWPATHTALAAALAWLIAHRVLGHAQPFFAPIAAAISLSISHTQRSRLDLLANAILSLVRAVTGALDDGESLPADVQDQIASFAAAIGALSDTPQPWPESVTRNAVEIASRAIEQATAQRVDRTPVIASILRAGARDLLALTEG
jgi:hypothetical protein